MKSSSSFQLLNKKEPKLYLEYELLQQIKYIVKIAPKEAQWFHRLTVDADGDFCLQDMFIPEQVCSSVEVDTDSMMMMRFYKELVTKHGAEETNKILSELNCWCHSHHNMGTSPSGQDVKQFGELVKASLDQKTNNPVVMLIFNKKDEYYCRAYDPATGNIYEGLEITVYSNTYDWIDQEAKLKFKEPVYKVSNTVTNTTAMKPTLPASTFRSTSYSQPSRTGGWYGRSSSNYYLQDEDIWSQSAFEQASLVNNYVSQTSTPAIRAEDFIMDYYGSNYSPLTIVTKSAIENIAEDLSSQLDQSERFILLCLAKKQSSFFEKAKQAKDKQNSNKKAWITSFVNAFIKDKRDIGYLSMLLTTCFEMAEHLELNLLEDFTMCVDDFYAEFHETKTEYTMYNPQGVDK